MPDPPQLEMFRAAGHMQHLPSFASPPAACSTSSSGQHQVPPKASTSQRAMPQADQPRKPRLQPQQDPWRMHKFVFAGGLAGAISRTATAPVDRVKMLLQVQESQRMTIKQALKMMSAEAVLAGSIKSYFKGNGTNVIKIAPETSIKLTLNDYLKRHVCRNQHQISPWERMVCGGVAGAVAQGMVYPLDTVRTRLAVCSKEEYCSIGKTAMRMARNEGLTSFYRGLVPSMIGILPYAGTDIALFEMFKDELLQRYDGNPPHIAILGAGMLSSVVAQFVSYPLALIRTRLQAQGVGGNPIKYHGMTDVLVQTIQKEGFLGLYKGLLPNLLKLAPAAGISWYVFETTKNMLGVDPRS
eukprot:jgi/Chrzof1/11732/Cz06g07120.t1